MPKSVSGISAWFVCSSTKIIPVLSVTPTYVYVDIPPFSGDSNCKVNITVGTKFKLFAYQYQYSSTAAVTVATTNALSYTITKTNMTTSYTINKV